MILIWYGMYMVWKLHKNLMEIHYLCYCPSFGTVVHLYDHMPIVYLCKQTIIIDQPLLLSHKIEQ
jgi:hypothetical protein